MNQTWFQFTQENCPEHKNHRTGVGINYLEICDTADGSMEEDAEHARAGILAVLQGRLSSFSLEYPCHSPDEKRWFSMSVVPLDLEDRSVIVVHTNITARKLMEDSLREKTKLLENIINSSVDYIYVKDRELRTVLCNNAFARVVGKTPADLYGKSDIENGWSADLIFGNPEEGSGGALQEDLSVLSGETLHSFRNIGEIGGERCIVDVIKVPLRSSNGEIFGLLGISRDVTERVDAEERLKKAKAQLRAFIRDAPVEMAMFDRGMTYLAASNRWVAEYAPGHSDLTGRNHYQICPDLPDHWKQAHRQSLAGETVRCDDDLWVQADGSKLWLRWVVLPWTDETGEIGGIIISAENVTRYRQAEEQLAKMRNEMQQTLEWQVAIQTVAALAHEMNQPLGSISILCAAANRMLANKCADCISIGDTARPGRLEQTLTRMAAEAERASGVVRHLLESLRKPENKREPTALPILLKETVGLARSDWFDEYRVTIDCPPDLPPVLVNRLQVQKVLLNLIGNAIEAMSQENTAHRRIWISAGAGDCARITVRDEGPGVAEEIRSQMFHPFVTSKPNGTGMGLAISRSLIEAQGGKLWYEAQDGPGATFRFTLPFCEVTS